MSKFQDLDRWRRPELFFAEVINKSARGEFREENTNVKIWYRATVIAVDVTGGRLENSNGSGELEHIIENRSFSVQANVGPSNPKNSIKARVLTDEFDQFVDDKDLRVFWPMMSEHDSIPIKPGEHVYVTFEDENFEHGLWFGKVPGHSGVNFFKGDSSYTSDESEDLNNVFDDGNSNTESNISDDHVASGRVIGKDLNKLYNGND